MLAIIISDAGSFPVFGLLTCAYADSDLRSFSDLRNFDSRICVDTSLMRIDVDLAFFGIFLLVSFYMSILLLRFL